MPTPIARELARRYGLHSVDLMPLDTLVNDVIAVTGAEGAYALKMYHPGRTPAAIEWELDLLLRLRERGAPVVQPVRGRGGYLQRFPVGHQERVGALFTWAPGAKPAPSVETYLRLGAAAARIHAAAEGFAPSAARETYDATLLIDEQLQRMRPVLLAANRWRTMVALGDRLKRRLVDPGLDQGICHIDLTLDNVHVAEGEMTVFDFDSAGPCWRAVEPWGVLRVAAAYFQAWLTGYRTVRPFGRADEAAVATFAIVGDLRVAAWKLGLAESSRGTPLLTAADVPDVVDGWLTWEAEHLTG